MEMSEFETVFEIEQHILDVHQNMNVFNLDHGMKNQKTHASTSLFWVTLSRVVTSLTLVSLFQTYNSVFQSTEFRFPA